MEKEIRQLNGHLGKEKNREPQEETRQGPRRKFLSETETYLGPWTGGRERVPEDFHCLDANARVWD